MSFRTLIVAIFLSPGLWASDWTQWGGTSRDGAWDETGILDRFPEGGLKVSWETEVGSGYASPVVGGGRVYIVDYRPKAETRTLEAIERVLCFDEATGKQLWSVEWETHYRRQMQSYATGPRAAPVLHDGCLYCIGATGVINCIDAVTGDLKWRRDALADFGAKVPVWGVSASPIVWKNTVIIPCGGDDGLLRALDLATGKEVWKTLPADYELPYCAPEIFEFDGTPQVIQWSKEKLSSFNPDTGEELWSIPFNARSNMGIGRPVKVGNRILVSCFYNGSMLVEVSGTSAKIVWKNGGKGERPNQTAGLHAVMTTPIVEGGYFYGTCSYGELRGLRLSDGERVWENKEYTRQGRWGSFFWAKNQDRYFVNNDVGELLIMKFTPKGPELIDRTRLIEPDTECGYGPRRFANALVNWVQPAYANRHVVIRSDSQLRRLSLEAN